MSYTTKVYKPVGADSLVVQSGGSIVVQSGGSVVMDGAAVSGMAQPVVTTAAATYTVTAAMSGTVFVATRDTSTQIFTLPAATTAGLKYTFFAGHVDGEINVDPGTGTMLGVAFAGTALTVATNKDLKNTAATNVVGDCVTVVSDGAKWLIINIYGIWAST